MHLQIWMRTYVHLHTLLTGRRVLFSSIFHLLSVTVSSRGRSSPSELHVSSTLVGILYTGETNREKPRSPPGPDAYIMMHCLPYQSLPSSFALCLFSCICFLAETGTLKLRVNYPPVAVLVCPLACFGQNTFVKVTRLRRDQSCNISNLRNPPLCVAQRGWYASMILSLLHKSK